MEHPFRRLPDAELDVMQALWECDIPALRADIDKRLQKEHPMAQTTLLTLLSRLAEKGFLHIEKRGRSASYTPLVKKSDYLAAQSRRLVKTLCGGSMRAFAAALTESGLTKEELDELRTLLEQDSL